MTTVPDATISELSTDSRKAPATLSPWPAAMSRYRLNVQSDGSQWYGRAVRSPWLERLATTIHTNGARMATLTSAAATWMRTRYRRLVLIAGSSHCDGASA